MTEMTKEFASELEAVRMNFRKAAAILQYGVYETVLKRATPWGFFVTKSVVEVVPPRKWHRALQRKFELHGVINKCMELARPADWQQLLLEWPHKAETDPTRLAYTRDERAGEADRQTITTIGKYITRHFPTLAAHQVRDMTALYASDQCKIVNTTAQMLHHLADGPKSCMLWDSLQTGNLDDHPYACYAPELGWSMAVRIEEGHTAARALLYTDGDVTWFVRSYTKHDTFSHSDTILEAWLGSKGINKRSDWEGACLAHIVKPNRHGARQIVVPYLDGDYKDVVVDKRADGTTYLTIVERGEYTCDNTDGTADDSSVTCEDCGDSFSEDDGYWVGMRKDVRVCDSCYNNNYILVTGRNGSEYSIHTDCSYVEVDGTYYDADYLSDNHICRLHNDEYCDLDDAVYIESADEYYREDDDAVCYDNYNSRYELTDNCVCLHDGSYCLQDDAWQCEHSGKWYASDEDSVDTTCGMTVHPDHADEYELDDEEDEEDEDDNDDEPVPAPTPAPVEQVQEVKEVAPAPIPFQLSGGHSLTSASHSLRNVVAVTTPNEALLYEQMRRNR